MQLGGDLTDRMKQFEIFDPLGISANSADRPNTCGQSQQAKAGTGRQ
jgi:hypothetical protein